MPKAKLKRSVAKAFTPPSKDASDQNLIWAVFGLLGVALLSAGFTAWACDYVVHSFQDSNTMALLITDAGVKSDDKNLEHQISAATNALLMLRDVGLSVVIGGFGVIITLVIRTITKPRA